MMGMRATAIAAVTTMGIAGGVQAQPVEWPRAATAVLDIVERETPLAAAPRPANLYRRGWETARRWRLMNNGNTEITFAEFMSWVYICRTMGCAGDTVGGKPYRSLGTEVRAERTRAGGQDPVVEAAYRWVDSMTPLATGASAKAAKANAELWGRNRDEVAGDFATTNIFTLGWLIARQQPTIDGQVDTLARFGLFAHGLGWIGERCYDMRRIAAVLDGPPRIEACQ